MRTLHLLTLMRMTMTMRMIKGMRMIKEMNDENDNKDDNMEEDDDNDSYKPPGSSQKKTFRRTLGVITRSMSRKGKGKEKGENEQIKAMKNYERNQFSFGVWSIRSCFY